VPKAETDGTPKVGRHFLEGQWLELAGRPRGAPQSHQQLLAAVLAWTPIQQGDVTLIVARRMP
jgi:hypothetical protein